MRLAAAALYASTMDALPVSDKAVFPFPAFGYLLDSLDINWA
jgi:hypothetical protein